MEVKPFNYLESEASGIVVKPIEKDFGWGTIEGCHLLSPAIVKNTERQGDGWFCEELTDGRLFAAVLDVSLAESLLGSDQEPITERRLLSDLELFLEEYLRMQDPARLRSIDILKNIITSFEPDYLRIWANQLLWGFSLAVGLFDPKKNMADLANLGTNILAQEKSQDQFQAVLSRNTRFYAPRPPRKQRYGGKISPQIKTLQFTGKILLATDGIITGRPFLRPQEVIIEKDPSSFLVSGQKAEGLYIVIQRKVI